jgi:hypothetical protein
MTASAIQTIQRAAIDAHRDGTLVPVAHVGECRMVSPLAAQRDTWPHGGPRAICQTLFGKEKPCRILPILTRRQPEIGIRSGRQSSPRLPTRSRSSCGAWRGLACSCCSRSKAALEVNSHDSPTQLDPSSVPSSSTAMPRFAAMSAHVCAVVRPVPVGGQSSQCCPRPNRCKRSVSVGYPPVSGPRSRPTRRVRRQATRQYKQSLFCLSDPVRFCA